MSSFPVATNSDSMIVDQHMEIQQNIVGDADDVPAAYAISSKSSLSPDTLAKQISMRDAEYIKRSPSLMRKSFTSLLPPAAALDPGKTAHTSCCIDGPLCRRLPIINPFGPFKMGWDFFVVLLLCWTSWEVPC